ncbi:hypothetical protein FRB91_005161 [Serendipita sp. 411]|nr:hypothetical protein FRB91_005161 [Serendipita sp. 411]
MSFLALQGNPLDSSSIITPLEMFSTTTSPSTNNIPHNPFSLAVPKREPSRPFDHEEAVQSRGISTIPLEQSLSNPFLHSHSQKFPLPSPPMSPVQIHSQPQVNNDKRARRKSISRLGQQQPARAFCTRRPSLRRTSRQSILGKRTMGVSVDPFPSGTEKSPVESSLGDVNGAWDEGGRRMDDSVRFDEDHSFKHIEDLHAPLNPHVRNKSPAFSLLRAYAAPLKINVTVETMTLTTTAAGGHAKSIPTAVDQKPCLPPQLSVPVFSPFSFESLDAFHEPVPSLSYPQPPRTVSSSTSSTPLVTPEASPLLTRGDAHRVGVHSSEGVPRRVENTEPIESLSVEDACPDHLKTGNKEKKKPNLTLDMHAIEGYPTVSRRKGEIVLVRESMGSSRRKNTARTPKHDEAVQNDP